MKTLEYKAKFDSPHTIVNSINKMLRDNEIQDIYVVINTQNKEVVDFVSGDLKGIGFAILCLQKIVLEAMEK